MPIYSYRCKECGHEFEQRQRMSADALTDCPECNGRIRRVVNSVGVVFKGSGFYVTDNRNGAKNGKTRKSSKSKDEKSSSESDKSTPKPESSTDTKKKESAAA